MPHAYFPEPVMVPQHHSSYFAIVGVSVFAIALVTAILAAIYDISTKFSVWNTSLMTVAIFQKPEESPKQRRSLTWGDSSSSTRIISPDMLGDAWFVNDAASAASDSQKSSAEVVIQSAPATSSNTSKELQLMNQNHNDNHVTDPGDHGEGLSEEHKTAILLSCQCKYDESLKYYEQALRGYEHRLGADHPRAISTAHSMAELLTDQGQYIQANDLYRKLYALSVKAVGEEHAETIEIVNRLAKLLHLQGKHEEAQGHYERVLRARDEMYGALDGLTLRCFPLSFACVPLLLILTPPLPLIIVLTHLLTHSLTHSLSLTLPRPTQYCQPISERTG